jgi:ribosomal protein S18 acetylase RimI-like enzyme
VGGGAVKPEGVRAVVVANASDLGMEALEAFAVASGFPVGWAGDMLGGGTVATVALANVGGRTQGVAMGWQARWGRFLVEEISATLALGPDTYLFGDFVSPEFRGRGIQRWLVAERLRAVGDAITIVHPLNAPSRRSYEREGFVVAGRFTRYQWGRRTWATCRARGFELFGADVIQARWD